LKLLTLKFYIFEKNNRNTDNPITMKKNLLIYSTAGIIAVAGLLLKLVFNLSFGSFLLWGGIVALVVAFISINLINASKNSGAAAEEELSTEMRINQAITKARQDKFKSESEIRRLKAWSQDAIVTTYSSLFPQGSLLTQKEKLLEQYPEMKAQYGEKLTFEMMDKCDTLVNGYQGQIELHESKIKVFEKLHEEYTELKEKIRLAKQKENQLNRLSANEVKLKAAQESTGAIAAEIEHSYTVDDLNKEVALKEEYFKQLEQLTYQYGSSTDTAGMSSYKSGLEGILKGLEKD